MTWREFFMKVFCEGDQPSFSRVFSGFIICFSLGWVTAIVRHGHALPDFAGLSLFIGTVYGIKQLANAANAIGGPK